MELSRNLFRPAGIENLKEKIKNGALLVDVRTEEEYHSEHAKDSINFPLETLAENFDALPKDKAIVLVCAKGIRTRMAENFLKRNGFEVYDGGSWLNFDEATD